MRHSNLIQIVGKRQNVVTVQELKDRIGMVSVVMALPIFTRDYLPDLGIAICDVFSAIGDFIQGRHRKEVIAWENRVVELDAQTPEQKKEEWRCKTFDFLNPYLERIEQRKIDCQKL